MSVENGVPLEALPPSERAEQQWGVNIDDDKAVLIKLVELGGKMPDVADLSNLWSDYQKTKKDIAA